MPILPNIADEDRLDRVVTLLELAVRDGGWYQPHRLVMLEHDPATPDSVTVLQRALPDGDHPLDHLLGFSAPPACFAIGGICFGWATPPVNPDAAEPPAARPSEHPSRRRIRMVTLLDRSGNERATASMDDGAVCDTPGSGTLNDALRRCLGLPTAPPRAGSGELFAVLWLKGLLSAPRGMAWSEAAALHPSCAWLRSLGRKNRGDDLEAAGRALEETMSWSTLRSSVASQPGPTLMAPELAAWMDDGMFARWLLDSHPPLTLLLESLSRTLAPAFFGRVKRTLDAWDLLDTGGGASAAG